MMKGRARDGKGRTHSFQKRSVLPIFFLHDAILPPHSFSSMFEKGDYVFTYFSALEIVNVNQ